MSLQDMPASIRRQLLLHAHDTELWASYNPQVPVWSILLFVLGLGFLVGGGIFFLPRAVLPFAISALLGLFLCAPLMGLGMVARRSRRERAAIRRRVLQAVSWQGSESVLDVGCGSGMLLNGAAKELTTGRAVGIDIWANHSGGGNLKLLLRHAREEGVADRIEFREADARDMPFEDATFDVVLSSWALHHISLSLEAFDSAVAEMIRVLSPGGTIVVVDVAHMIDVLATRLENAGLKTTTTRVFPGQKMVVGFKNR